MSEPALTMESLPRAVDQIDAVDLQLIAQLQADGRATYMAMSQNVQLSSEAVRNRVERLVRTGVVKVVGSVDPALLGYGTFALVAITVDHSALDVAEALTQMSQTDFVASTAGEFDLLVEVVCRDDDELLAALEEIRLIPHVRGLRTFTYLEFHKYTYGRGELPALGGVRGPTTTPEVAVLDEADEIMIDALRADGRTSFTELAHLTGLPYPSARRRAIRLFERGVLRTTTVVNPLVFVGRVQAGIGLHIDGDVGAVAAQLENIPEVGMAITTAGVHDMMLEVTCTGKQELARLVGSTLRAVKGIRSTQTYTYLRIHKLAYTWSGSTSS